MSQHFTYKRVFARLYSPDSLANRTLGEAIVLQPDGRLAIQLLSPPDVIDLGLRQPIRSAAMLAEGSSQEAVTPDGRYRVQVDMFEQDEQGSVESWLIHIDQTSGKFKRAKLGNESHLPPRIAVSPGGTFFLADDNGTVRLYDAPNLLDMGVFQVAHASTQNQITALAVNSDDSLVAALSSWKDFVLYHVPERRVVAVRHIDDPTGWYDPATAFILIAGHGAAIVTAGCLVGSGSESSTGSTVSRAALSINVFRYVPQQVVKKEQAR